MKVDKETELKKTEPSKDVKEVAKEPKEVKDADTLTFEGLINFTFLNNSLIISSISILFLLCKLDIRENIKLIERGIQTKETRYLIRVMRNLFSTRKRLNDPVLKRLINYYYITSNVQADKEFLLSFIDLNAVSTAAIATTSAAVKFY